jgi:hypothetical protein
MKESKQAAAYRKRMGVRPAPRRTRVTKIYDIYVNPLGTYYESIRITGDDEDHCQQQLEAYLDTKQDCYGFEKED